MAAPAAMAWWRLPARSIRRDRLRRLWKTARSCSRRCVRMTRRIRHLYQLRHLSGGARSISRSKACALVSRKNTGWTECRKKSRRFGSRGSPGSKSRARKLSMCRCRIRNMRFRLIILWHRPRRLPTSPAMMACVMGRGWPGIILTRPIWRAAQPALGPRCSGV